MIVFSWITVLIFGRVSFAASQMPRPPVTTNPPPTTCDTGLAFLTSRTGSSPSVTGRDPVRSSNATASPVSTIPSPITGRPSQQDPGQPHDVVAEHSGPSSHGGQDRDNQANAAKVTAGVITPSDPAPASGTFSCLGGDPCAGMSAVGGSCIPYGSTGSLAAPPPSTVPFAADTQAPVAVASSYTYLPESPSPADLCISRT